MIKNTIINGDSLAVLKTIPCNTFDMCVTSPPYWGLRDYGIIGQLGAEKTPESYVSKMVHIFREVRRTIRSGGTLWLNLGDTYAGGGRGGTANAGDKQMTNRGSTALSPSGYVKGIKQKDLVGIPWRVAFALQADGWYLRQDIIWHKPNPMPESVTDRCTKAHEYIFLLTKSAKYYFDADAIKEPAVWGCEKRIDRQTENNKSMPDKLRNGIRPSWKGSKFHTGKTGEHQLGRASKKRGEFNGKTESMPGRNAFRAITEMRNKRSVWTVTTKPYAGAHFATFPKDLIEPCIKSGCPADGLVLDPFMGAGTTAIVAKNLGRNYTGIELNPAYIELAKKRMEGGDKR